MLAIYEFFFAVNDEPIHEQAFERMVSAREDCTANYEATLKGDEEGANKLMYALITAWLAMAECGNSRPASGSEHPKRIA